MTKSESTDTGLAAVIGEAVNDLSRTATRVWILPPVKKVFILVNEEWFQNYLTDASNSVHDDYVACILKLGHVSILKVPTHSNDGYEGEG